MPGMEKNHEFISAVVNLTNFQIWECKLRKESLPVGIFYENLSYNIRKALKMSKHLRTELQKLIFLCAGTIRILPDGMANWLDEPDLDTSTEQENMETTQDEERAARRERRQRQKEEEDDPSLLDVQDEEEEGPVTRSRSPTAGNTGESGQDAPASGSPLPAVPPPPPPPPPTTPWWMAPATWPSTA